MIKQIKNTIYREEEENRKGKRGIVEREIVSGREREKERDRGRESETGGGRNLEVTI